MGEQIFRIEYKWIKVILAVLIKIALLSEFRKKEKFNISSDDVNLLQHFRHRQFRGQLGNDPPKIENLL